MGLVEDVKYDSGRLSRAESGDRVPSNDPNLVGKGPETGGDNKLTPLCIAVDGIELERGEGSTIIGGSGNGSGAFFFPLEGEAACEIGEIEVEFVLENLQPSLAFTWSISLVRFFRRTVS